jgi:hypothetical protein
MFIYLIYNHNWRNISPIYIYNETSNKRTILTIKKIHREVGQAKNLSTARYRELIEKPEGKRPLRIPGRGWKDNIKMTL